MRWPDQTLATGWATAPLHYPRAVLPGSAAVQGFDILPQPRPETSVATVSQVDYYDSDVTRKPLITEVRNLWAYRGLLKLLTMRDLTVRYKRSVLGIWWTLLNPLLQMAVMWLVFGEFFRFAIPGDIPFVIYLLSGIVLVTFFSQAVTAVGSAIINSSAILAKVSVPAEIFSTAAALAGLVNFGLSLLLLLVFQLLLGVGIPWTFVLVVLPALCLLMLVAGLGLLIASAAVFFYDVLDLVGVVIMLITYATPTFYPVSIVPERYLGVIYANPLYSYLEIFRALIYGGTFGELWQWVVMVGTAVVALVGGVWVFSRSWRRLAVLL